MCTSCCVIRPVHRIRIQDVGDALEVTCTIYGDIVGSIFNLNGTSENTSQSFQSLALIRDMSLFFPEFRHPRIWGCLASNSGWQQRN